MNFDDFVPQALRTESVIDKTNINVEYLKKLLRLHIISGTLLDYCKKGIFYNNWSKHDDNYLQLVEKLNDSFTDMMMEHPSHRSEINNVNFRLIHGLLGTVTESSEVAEILLKYLETGEYDKVNIFEESSDISWYDAILFDELGGSKSVALQNVIDKLKVRFPDKFDEKLAANRNLTSERKELEK